MNVVQIPRRFVRNKWGGTETVILETSQSLQKQGHGVEVFCPNALADADQEEMDGVRVRRFPYFYPYLGLAAEARTRLDRKGGNLVSFPLKKALQGREGLDLIHLHTGKRLGAIGRTVARKKGIPYVISLHGGFLDVPRQEAASWTAPTRGSLEWGKLLGWWFGSRSVLEDAAAVICVSREEQQRLRERLPQQRVEYLPNGVDFDRFCSGNGARFRLKHQIPAGDRVVLNVGRIDPQKNQVLLVELLHRMRNREPRLQLVLAGPVTNADYHRNLLHTVRRYGLQKRVTMLTGLQPFSGELVDAYHAADLFVLPSVHEPFGIVLLEAWCAGLPVVASQVGGVPSFVENGRDGLLFEPRSVGDCLKKVECVLAHPELAGCLSRRGQRKARRQFSWDGITRNLIEIYEEVRDENRLR